MKANAPDKLYFGEYDRGLLNIYSTKESSDDIEYIRTDAFIDSFKTEDVDLKREIEDWVKTGPHTSYPWCTIPDAIRITAEHFFELGLKAQKGE